MTMAHLSPSLDRFLGDRKPVDRDRRPWHPVCLYFWFYLCFLFVYFSHRVLAIPLDRFWSAMAHSTCFPPSKCLLGVSMMNIVSRSTLSKTKILGQNRHFKPKFAKLSNEDIFETVSSINTKFEHRLPVTETLRVRAHFKMAETAI